MSYEFAIRYWLLIAEGVVERYWIPALALALIALGLFNWGRAFERKRTATFSHPEGK